MQQRFLLQIAELICPYVVVKEDENIVSYVSWCM